MNQEFFRPLRGPIIVEARATGPMHSNALRLLVDTGATGTMIHLPILLALGFDLDRDGQPIQVLTASTSERASRVTLTRLFALGQNRIGFPVTAHMLPEAAKIDGLLGLDFFQGHILTLDFQAGSITLV